MDQKIDVARGKYDSIAIWMITGLFYKGDVSCPVVWVSSEDF